MSIDRDRHDEYSLDQDQAAANQVIYLAIVHWVVGNLYLNSYINCTTRLDYVFMSGCDQSRYMPVNCFYDLKKWGDISYDVPLRLKTGGDVFPSSPTYRRPCSNPTFWQRNLSFLKWE